MNENTKKLDSCEILLAEQVMQRTQNQIFSLLRERKIEEERQLPCFDIKSIRKDDFARINTQFNFFIELLQAWNDSVSRQNIKFNRARFEMLNFIFFHLKNIALQDEGIKNENISRLFQWYHDYNNQFRLTSRIKGLRLKARPDNDDQVRRTFTSSLPQKIESFQRKVFLPQCNRKKKMDPLIIKPSEGSAETHFIIEQKKLKAERQQKQMKATISDFHRRKMRLDQTRTGLMEHSLNLSKQVRRLPRDQKHREVYDCIISSRVSKRQFGRASRRPVFEKTYTEVSPFANCIDGLTLQRSPFEHLKKLR